MRLQSVLGTSSESASGSPGAYVVVGPLTGAPTVILVADVAVRLGERTIFEHVDLEMRAGEFVAVLGPNGSGKSTLIKAILGIQPLESGSISVLGETVRRGRPDIGYVPQRRHFDSDLRIRGRDIVRLGLDGAQWGIGLPFLGRDKERGKAQLVQQAIESVGAAEYAERPIGELSGGEQQRLLIAQALVTRPRILALDEPLDSLDLKNQQGVAQVVKRFAAETGATVLLVAHDVNPIIDMLDRVVYLAGGRVASGEPHEVITTETLTRLYGSPVEVLRASDGRLVVVGHADREGVTYHAH